MNIQHSTFNIQRALAALLCAVLLVLAPGCATTSRTPEQKAEQIQLLSYTAASIGTAIAIQENPDLKPKFDLAYSTLNTLVETKVITGLLLRDIVNTLPVKELKSPNARIAIDGATYLYTASVGEQLNIENSPYVLAAATGICDGMKAALGK